jgi:hypothetical protein
MNDYTPGNSQKSTHRVVMSVARPVSPKYILSVTGKIYVGMRAPQRNPITMAE